MRSLLTRTRPAFGGRGATRRWKGGYYSEGVRRGGKISHFICALMDDRAAAPLPSEASLDTSEVPALVNSAAAGGSATQGGSAGGSGTQAGSAGSPAVAGKRYGGFRLN